ncbi:MAG: Rrf2 family transcriptional regulator [Treponema sp.]|nr:Rrf2 family transcriptional regulator [Treponema sp.]
MYKISARSQYALLIMEDLAVADRQKYIPLKTLSHRRNLSVKYLEQILIQLGKAGLVIGFRGSNGGYKLAKPVEDYTVGEILRAIEGEVSPVVLLDNNTIMSEGSKSFWKNFETVINEYVDSVTLDALVQRNKAFVGYDYSI